MPEPMDGEVRLALSHEEAGRLLGMLRVRRTEYRALYSKPVEWVDSVMSKLQSAMGIDVQALALPRDSRDSRDPRGSRAGMDWK